MRSSCRWTPSGSCFPPSPAAIHTTPQKSSLSACPSRHHCTRQIMDSTMWHVCKDIFHDSTMRHVCKDIFHAGPVLASSSVCSTPGSLDLQWICRRLVCRHTPLSRANNNALYIHPYPPPYHQITATAAPIPADADLTEEVAFFQVRARVHSLLRTRCNALYSDGTRDNCISSLSCISSRFPRKSAYTCSVSKFTSLYLFLHTANNFTRCNMYALCYWCRHRLHTCKRACIGTYMQTYVHIYARSHVCCLPSHIKLW